MSRSKRSHLAPVPQDPKGTPPDAPAPRAFPQRIELPTGGRAVDGLLRELVRTALGPALTGFSFELDRTGPRCFITVQAKPEFDGERITQGLAAVTRALLALGIVKPAKPAAEDPAPPDATEAPQGG